MAPYALHLDRAVKILDMLDVDSEKWAAYALTSRWPARAIWQREARTLLAYERHAAMHCDQTFFVTEDEMRRFIQLAPETSEKLTWFQNGVDIDRFSPGLHGDFPTKAMDRTWSSPDIWIIGRMPKRSFGSLPRFSR